MEKTLDDVFKELTKHQQHQIYMMLGILLQLRLSFTLEQKNMLCYFINAGLND